MKNLKRFTILGAVALATVAITACTNGDNNGNTNGNTTPETTAATTANTPEATTSPTPVAMGNIDLENFTLSDALDETGAFIGITATDLVQAFDTSIVVPAHIHTVSDADVQEVLDMMLQDFAQSTQITEGTVAHGDTINIDFVGSVDGVEFAGGNTFGGGMDVTIGVTSFIDDFLYQLIGHSPGDVVNVEVTFPDSYPQEPSLEGAEALFVTTINYFVGDPIFPELTDDFIEEQFGAMGFTTVAQVRQDIEDFIHEGSIRNFIEDYLRNEISVSYVPQFIIEYHQHMFLEQEAETAMQIGIDLETLIGWYGVESVDELLAMRHGEILAESEYALIIQAIAEMAEIHITRDDVVAFFEEMGFGGIEMFEELYGLPWLVQFVRTQEALDFIHENIILG